MNYRFAALAGIALLCCITNVTARDEARPAAGNQLLLRLAGRGETGQAGCFENPLAAQRIPIRRHTRAAERPSCKVHNIVRG